MKKKLIILVMMMVMIFTLSACGGGNDGENAVSKALDAVKSGDMEAASKYFGGVSLMGTEVGVDMSDEEQDMMNLFFKHMDYKIISSEEKGDAIDVTVEIENNDMAFVFPELMTEIVGLALSGLDEGEMEAKMIEILEELIDSDENEKVSKSVIVSVQKVEDEWTIDATDEFLDAMLGGMISATAGIAESFMPE